MQASSGRSCGSEHSQLKEAGVKAETVGRKGEAAEAESPWADVLIDAASLRTTSHSCWAIARLVIASVIAT